jgi:HEAT repeat protein
MKQLLTGLLALTIWAVTTAEAADVADAIKKLKSDDSDVRRAAARELADLGPEAKSAVAALTAALKDKDLFVRRFAAQALGEIGPDAKSAVPVLKGLLRDSHKEAQEAAVVALGKMGSAGVTELALVVRDPGRDAALRRKAAEALGTLGPDAKSAVAALTAALRNGGPGGKGKAARRDMASEDIRAEVARALSTVAASSDKAAVAALKEIAEGKERNREVKMAAVQAYRKLTGKNPEMKKKK